MDLIRRRFLDLCSTHQYMGFPAKDMEELHIELSQYMKLDDPKLTDLNKVTLMEMLFYIKVLVSEDIEAEVIYRTLCDQIGENSPRMHVMKGTLLQITEGDKKAVEYLKKLLDEVLEFDTDAVDYLCVSKKLLSIQKPVMSQEAWIREVLSVVEKFPLDGELWWALAAEYQSLGHFDRAAYCLEEILIVSPFAYSVFAQLGEVLYYKGVHSKKIDNDALQEALRNSLRAVELSETCTKGWSFVAVISARLKKRELFELSCRKLEEIEGLPNLQDRKIARHILRCVKYE